jgi:hypothetical protein
MLMHILNYIVCTCYFIFLLLRYISPAFFCATQIALPLKTLPSIMFAIHQRLENTFQQTKKTSSM